MCFLVEGADVKQGGEEEEEEEAVNAESGGDECGENMTGADKGMECDPERQGGDEREGEWD